MEEGEGRQGLTSWMMVWCSFGQSFYWTTLSFGMSFCATRRAFWREGLLWCGRPEGFGLWLCDLHDVRTIHEGCFVDFSVWVSASDTDDRPFCVSPSVTTYFTWSCSCRGKYDGILLLR